jgi:hypothetical protein
MLDRSVSAQEDAYAVADVVEAVRELSSRELKPIVRKIDAEGYYPEAVLRAFGRVRTTSAG